MQKCISITYARLIDISYLCVMSGWTTSNYLFCIRQLSSLSVTEIGTCYDEQGQSKLIRVEDTPYLNILLTRTDRYTQLKKHFQILHTPIRLISLIC